MNLLLSSGRFGPDETFKEEANTAQAVLEAYENAMKDARAAAFAAAVGVWRECNPDASPALASPGVATILCRKF